MLSRVASNSISLDGEAFVERAGSLADWANRILVNRTDAWGSYRGDGQFTERGTLTRSILERHFAATAGTRVIGLHTANADNLSKGGAVDIDQHGSDSAKTAINLASALHWYRSLVRFGFRPLLYSSNGKGGYHLRLLLSEQTTADRIFFFLRWLTSDYECLGMAKAPEQFPKQPDVRRCSKRLGNWIRLPGRHHKRNFWSEVWDGACWLSGREAVDFILSLTGDTASLVPRIPEAESLVVPTKSRPRSVRSSLEYRIERYFLCLPNASEGEGRDDIAYRFACFLMRDMGRSEAEALNWLEIWDLGNRPPKGRARLQRILRNAMAYGQRPIGSGLAV